MSGIGRYRIDGELGRGAMGVVHSAWDTTLERSVALKELRLPIDVAPEMREDLEVRFLREARAAARLQHPNVVQVYDVFSEGGRHFIAMELLEGAPLSELLERGPLQHGAAQQVLLQTLDAVQAAHDAGIIHRDLKPDNIYVLGDGRVKVTDFGIAKLADGPTATHATQIGTIIGTPGYMAPEQVQGLPVDTRADIFALGVLGYELFGGHNPFVANSPTATLFRIVNEPPTVAAGIPPSVAGVLGKATEKEPSRRYGTAAEMAADLMAGTVPVLHAGAAGSVVSASADAAGSNRKLIGGVALAGSALVIGLLVVALSGGTGGQAAPGGGAPSESVEAVVPPVEPARSDPEPAVEPEPEPDPVPEGDGILAVPFWGAFVYANDYIGDAESEASRLESVGYRALVLDTAMYSTIGKPGQSIWVVCAGPFATKAEAEDVASQLKMSGWPGAYTKQVAY